MQGGLSAASLVVLFTLGQAICLFELWIPFLLSGDSFERAVIKIIGWGGVEGWGENADNCS